MTPCDQLEHPALERVPGARSVSGPPDGAELTDRGRLALLLQAAALLSHLETGGWRLAAGWRAASVDDGGRLRGLSAAAGRRHRYPLRRLADLAARLFGGEEIAGRGAARRVVRQRAESWRRRITPGSPDRAVAEILDAAGFLWSAGFGPARAALGAVHVRRGERRLRVAGPSWFRRAALTGVASRRELGRRLAAPRAKDLWRPPGAARGPGRARRLFDRGRFGEALAVLEGRPSLAAAVLRVRCLLWLERLAAARREVEDLARCELAPRQLLEVARVAVAAWAGEPAAAAWVERAVDSVPGWLRPEAHLLAAEEAAGRRDAGRFRRHLRRSRVVLEQPALAWRWYRAAGRAALDRGRGALAAACFSRALAAHRRRLPPFVAARLWTGVAEGRRIAGDHAAAERAAAHAVRLHEVAGEPRATRDAPLRLAGLRLRRGETAGLGGLLSAAPRDAAEADEIAVLAARRELVRGRPEAALERLGVRPAAGRLAAERAALAARALGWLGRPRRARRMLSAAGESGARRLEAEERPALWALAGERRRARGAAGGPSAALWRALLAGKRAGAAEWAAVDGLPSYRRARLVYDAELLAPGFCPAARIQRAAQLLARAGAAAFAARLEAAERSAWQALADYLAGDEPGAGPLLAAAGAPEARLWYERDGRRTVVVGGRGGEARLEVPAGGGRFVLAAPAAHPRLAAVLRLIADRRPPPGRAEPPPGGGGMVGRSPALRAALERAAVFARTSLPVLVRGETGTGKELLSRRVHALSQRASGPFLPVNCAAVARDLLLSDLFGHVRGAFTGADRDRAGVFESARGGTVFLDEIGDLPPSAQGALLRVLQEGEVRRIGESRPRRVDARVVAATHRDLEALVGDGRFREDLFFRLRAASIVLPPLRRRGDDVLLLAEHFLRRARPGGTAKLGRAARARLLGHDWPGNVRELENAMAVAAAMSGGGVIRAEHLELDRPADGGALGYHQRVARYRRRLIEEALIASGGNRAAAARRIGLSRQAMSYLVRSLGVRAGALESAPR